MKNALIFFLLGVIAGAVLYRAYTRSAVRPPESAAVVATAQTAASDARDALAQKLKDWKLTPEDIKADLAKTGRVVRAKSAMVGDRIDDARVVAVIKAKYVLDSELSALAINVDCQNGEVTLTGTVKSPELIGRAIALALDTHGVQNVVSRLAVSA